MKKIISSILIIIGLVIIACLALPKYFSSQNKSFVENFLTGLKQGSNGQVTGKIIEESNGWFSSKTEVQITLSPFSPQMRKLFKGANTFDLTVIAHYGPVIISQNGVAIGQALIHATLANNAKTAKYFIEPLISSNYLISLTGNGHIKAQGFKTTQTHEIQFDGFQSTLQVNKSATAINGKINFGQVKVVNSKDFVGTVTIAPSTQTLNLTKAKSFDHIWLGTKKLKIPNITIVNKENNFKAEIPNISLNSDITMQNKLLNATMKLNAPDFIVNNKKASFSTNFTFNKVNPEALNALSNLAQSIKASQTNPQLLPEESKKILQTAISVFGGNSSVSLNSSLQYNGSDSVSLSTGYDNSQSTSKIHFNLNAQKDQKPLAGFNFNVAGLDKSTLGKLLKYMISLVPDSSKSDTPTQNSEQMEATTVALLQQLFTPGSQINLNIIAPSKNVGFQLLDAKAYFRDLKQKPSIQDLITDAQLDANWKIPVYATGLLKIFAPVVISKLETPQDRADAKDAYAIFQQLLPLMIKQGYLQQQGEFYVSNWNINSNNVLMNNKPLQPLIAEVIMLQQQQEKAQESVIPAIPSFKQQAA